MQPEELAIGVRVIADAGLTATQWPWQNQIGTIIDVSFVAFGTVTVDFEKPIRELHRHRMNHQYLRLLIPEEQDRIRRQEHAMKYL